MCRLFNPVIAIPENYPMAWRCLHMQEMTYAQEYSWCHRQKSKGWKQPKYPLLSGWLNPLQYNPYDWLLCSPKNAKDASMRWHGVFSRIYCYMEEQAIERGIYHARMCVKIKEYACIYFCVTWLTLEWNARPGNQGCLPGVGRGFAASFMHNPL